MKASKEEKSAPPAEGKWVSGAAPLALCMSCNQTFPLEVIHCPKCHVSLSVVIKCPECERVQSAQHEFCIYCANAFLREAGLGLSGEGFDKPLHELALRPIYVLLGTLIFLGAIASIYIYLRRDTLFKPAPPAGQSYILVDTSLRRKASLDSPPIKDLKPSEIVNITDYSLDTAGNRWFEVSSEEISGYVLIQDVAPPKTGHPEKGYALLRHSLLGLENPAVLPDANLAVEYYRRRFPDSRHRDELTWLLAEQTRSLASDAPKQGSLLASARELYGKLAEGEGEFAEPARQALAQLPTEGGGGKTRSPRRRAPMRLSIIGGEGGSSQPAASGSSGGPVRGLTVVSRTPLAVNLPEGAELSTGLVLQGVIAQDVLVNREIAVPRGSLCLLTVAEVNSPSSVGGTSSSSIRLTAVIVNGRSHRVSAGVVRVNGRSRSAGSSPADASAPRLPSGTRVTFRLSEPLMVPHR